MKYLLLSTLCLALLTPQNQCQACPAHHGGKGKAECSPETCSPSNSDKAEQKAEQKDTPATDKPSDPKPAEEKK